MKRIILLFIIIATVISCSEEFVERYPTTSAVVESFYQTPEDASQAVTSIYNVLLRDDWWSPRISSEIASDNCAGGAGTGDGGGFQRWDRGLQQPEATANQEPWRIYYGGIYRANVYLENEEQIDWSGNEDLRIQYQAEARFLRAYFHFLLTKMFGEIPALDHTLGPNEYVGRTPAEELYAFIIDDLEFAAENAISSPYPGFTDSWGRATSWAAKSMLGRVYLFYSGYYNDPDIEGFTATDARNHIDDVIQNSGHGLVDQYASLWRVPTYSELGSDSLLDQYAGEINQEVIWSVRYNSVGLSSTVYGGAWYQRMIGPRNTDIQPYGRGWGAMPVIPDLWELYDDADTRKTASILSWDDEGLTYNYEDEQQAQYTGYDCKKYEIAYINGEHEAFPNWQWDGIEDYIVIRFADVLLMGAELHLITPDGNQATADAYANQVRERAIGDNSQNYSGITRDEIFTERRLELVFEGIRYWDILRSCQGDFSQLVNILTYVDDTDGGDFSNTSNTTSLDVNGSNFAEKKGLFQIPQNELDLMNDFIEQNLGYTTD